jgi:hypothetical protein
VSVLQWSPLNSGTTVHCYTCILCKGMLALNLCSMDMPYAPRSSELCSVPSTDCTASTGVALLPTCNVLPQQATSSSPLRMHWASPPCLRGSSPQQVQTPAHS